MLLEGEDKQATFCDQDTPMIACDQDTPMIACDQDTPMIACDQDTPMIACDQDTPMIACDQDTPMIACDQDTPMIACDQDTPMIACDQDTPMIACDQDTPMIACDVKGAYEDVVKWKRNIFTLPKGQVGKMFIQEMTSLINTWCNKTEWREIAITSVMILLTLMLQKASPKSKTSENKKILQRRLTMWKDGKMDELVRV